MSATEHGCKNKMAVAYSNIDLWLVIIVSFYLSQMFAILGVPSLRLLKRQIPDNRPHAR